MSEDVIQFIPAQDLPGGWRKRLTVPEGYTTLLVVEREVVGQRPAGDQKLSNWPRPAPDVVLVSLKPFDLRPRIQHLGSGQREVFDLVWPITVQIEDAVRLFETWLAQEPDPATALVDLEDHLAGLLWQSAQEQAIEYDLMDLQTDEQIQRSLGGALLLGLRAALGEVGLVLVGSQRPQPRTLDDEQAELEAMNQLARAARDARFEALFERLEDKEMLVHRLNEWFAEQGEGPPDPDLVDRLWQIVDQSPEEAATQAREAAEALQREVEALRLTLHSERTNNERRFRQLETRLEKEAPPAKEPRPAAERSVFVWRNVLWLLRLFGYGLTLLFGLAAFLLPRLYEEYDKVRGAVLIFTSVVGVLTIITDLWLRGRLRRARAAAQEARRAESRASLNRRLEVDHLVRARIEAGLKQVSGNLEGAWKKGYQAGGAARDLAAKMRTLAQQAARFGEEEVRAANYRARRYLAQDRVPDEQLGAVLGLDEDLLARSQSLAQTAEVLYGQVNAGQVEQAGEALRSLDDGLNALRNRFTERDAYLVNPA